MRRVRRRHGGGRGGLRGAWEAGEAGQRAGGWAEAGRTAPHDLRPYPRRALCGGAPCEPDAGAVKAMFGEA